MQYKTVILYKYSILMLAFTDVYEDKGRFNFYLIRDELKIGNFHSNPLMDLTKSLRWTLSSFLRSLELGCLRFQEKGILQGRSDVGGRSLLN